MSVLQQLSFLHERVCLSGERGIPLHDLNVTVYLLGHMLRSRLYLIRNREDSEDMSQYSAGDIFENRNHILMSSNSASCIWRARGLTCRDDVLQTSDSSEAMELISNSKNTGVQLLEVNKQLGSKTAANQSIIKLCSLGLMTKKKLIGNHGKITAVVILHLTKFSKAFVLDGSSGLDFDLDEAKFWLMELITSLIRKQGSNALQVGEIGKLLGIHRKSMYAVRDYVMGKSQAESMNLEAVDLVSTRKRSVDLKPNSTEFSRLKSRLASTIDEDASVTSWHLRIVDRSLMQANSFGAKILWNLPLYHQIASHICESAEGRIPSELRLITGLDRKRARKVIAEFIEYYKVPATKFQDGKQVSNRLGSLPFKFGGYGTLSMKKSREEADTADTTDATRLSAFGTTSREERSQIVLTFIKEVGVCLYDDAYFHLRKFDMQNDATVCDRRTFNRLLETMRTVDNILTETVTLPDGVVVNNKTDVTLIIDGSRGDRESLIVSCVKDIVRAHEQATRQIAPETCEVSCSKPVTKKIRKRLHPTDLVSGHKLESIDSPRRLTFHDCIMSLFGPNETKEITKRNYFDNAISRKKDARGVLSFICGYRCPGFILSAKKFHEFLHETFVVAEQNQKSKRLILRGLCEFKVSDIIEKLPVKLCVRLMSLPEETLSRIAGLLDSEQELDDAYCRLGDSIKSPSKLTDLMHEQGSVISLVVSHFISCLRQILAMLNCVGVLNCLDNTDYSSIILGQSIDEIQISSPVEDMLTKTFQIRTHDFENGGDIVCFWDSVIIPLINQKIKADERYEEHFHDVLKFEIIFLLRSRSEPRWFEVSKYSKHIQNYGGGRLPVNISAQSGSTPDADEGFISILDSARRGYHEYSLESIPRSKQNRIEKPESDPLECSTNVINTITGDESFRSIEAPSSEIEALRSTAASWMEDPDAMVDEVEALDEGVTKLEDEAWTDFQDASLIEMFLASYIDHKYITLPAHMRAAIGTPAPGLLWRDYNSTDVSKLIASTLPLDRTSYNLGSSRMQCRKRLTYLCKQDPPFRTLLCSVISSKRSNCDSSFITRVNTVLDTACLASSWRGSHTSLEMRILTYLISAYSFTCTEDLRSGHLRILRSFPKEAVIRAQRDLFNSRYIQNKRGADGFRGFELTSYFTKYLEYGFSATISSMIARGRDFDLTSATSPSPFDAYLLTNFSASGSLEVNIQVLDIASEKIPQEKSVENEINLTQVHIAFRLENHVYLSSALRYPEGVSTIPHEIISSVSTSAFRIQELVESRNSLGISRRDLYNHLIRTAMETKDIDLALEEALSSGVIFTYSVEYDNEWFFSRKYHALIGKVPDVSPWFSPDGVLNCEFYSFLVSRILSALSLKTEATVEVIQSEIHILSLCQTQEILDDLEAQKIIICLHIPKITRATVFDDELETMYDIFYELSSSLLYSDVTISH